MEDERVTVDVSTVHLSDIPALIMPRRGDPSRLDEIVRRVDGRRSVGEIAGLLGLQAQEARERVAMLVLHRYIIVRRRPLGTGPDDLLGSRLKRKP